MNGSSRIAQEITPVLQSDVRKITLRPLQLEHHVQDLTYTFLDYQKQKAPATHVTGGFSNY